MDITKIPVISIFMGLRSHLTPPPAARRLYNDRIRGKGKAWGKKSGGEENLLTEEGLVADTNQAP